MGICYSKKKRTSKVVVRIIRKEESESEINEMKKNIYTLKAQKAPILQLNKNIAYLKRVKARSIEKSLLADPEYLVTIYSLNSAV